MKFRDHVATFVGVPAMIVGAVAVETVALPVIVAVLLIGLIVGLALAVFS